MYTDFVGKMLGSKNLADKSGITLVQTRDKFAADIVVCQAQKIRFPASCPYHVNAAKKAGRYRRDQKLIYVESADTGSVEQQRRHFHVIQSLERSPGRVPFEPLTPELADDLIVKNGCPPTSSEKFTRKIVVAVPFPITLRDGEFLYIPDHKVAPMSSRTTDVVFVGKSWAKEKALAVHRGGLVAALNDIQKRHKQWKMIVGGMYDKKVYLKILTETKIFISPFGAGEWSFKDEEATLRGAVLMKPGAGFLESAIPIYHPNVTCIDVRPDWKGLEKILQTYLGNLPLLQKVQTRAHYESSRFRSMEHAVRQEDLQAKYSEIVRRAVPRHAA